MPYQKKEFLLNQSIVAVDCLVQGGNTLKIDLKQEDVIDAQRPYF